MGVKLICKHDTREEAKLYVEFSVGTYRLFPSSSRELQSQSKWLGHFGVSLSPQCWCTRFGDRTAINNFERDEVSTRREKTAFG